MNYNINSKPYREYDFSVWSERSVVADCLRDLGYKELASFSLKPSTHEDFIQDCINLVSKEANSRKDYGIIDRLAFAGLSIVKDN